MLCCIVLHTCWQKYSNNTANCLKIVFLNLNWITLMYNYSKTSTVLYVEHWLNLISFLTRCFHLISSPYFRLFCGRTTSGSPSVWVMCWSRRGCLFVLMLAMLSCWFVWLFVWSCIGCCTNQFNLHDEFKHDLLCC